MFVAVMLDMSSEDHQISAEKILKIFGFQEKCKSLFESTTLGEKTLTRLKRELDKVCDSYDTIFFYQFPVDETLVITSLSKKHWRRRAIRQQEE